MISSSSRTTMYMNPRYCGTILMMSSETVRTCTVRGTRVPTDTEKSTWSTRAERSFTTTSWMRVLCSDESWTERTSLARLLVEVELFDSVLVEVPDWLPDR